MSERPTTRIGAISGGGTAGRDTARAVAAGVTGAGNGLPPGRQVRIETLRVHAPEGVDPCQVTAAVEREIRRAIARREP